jgi:hypothetical protein
MRLYGSILILLITLFLAGCASFKELKPDPDLYPTERGYIELKDGKDNFELLQGKKYFIKFPAPMKDKFYLVLVTQEKPFLHSYVTNTFDDGKGPIVPIVDEAVSDDSISVYAIDRKSAQYYWVIDEVRRDLVLSIHYRYAPQWRYTFENKYTRYRDDLTRNTADRSTYNGIDASYNTDKIDFARELPAVEEKTANLKSTKDELQKLESIFPSDIAASRDTAYEKYVALRKTLDDELTFQENYASVLSFFKKEKESRGNVLQFLDAAPYFTGVLNQQNRYPAPAMTKMSQTILRRLGEVGPFLDDVVRAKLDAGPISPQPKLSEIADLYQACGQQIPRETESLLTFIERFNVEANGVQAAKGKFDAMRKFFTAGVSNPTETFFADLVTKTNDIKNGLPQSQANRFEKYGNYPCAVGLAREIATTSNRAADFLTVYQAAGVVNTELRAHAWAPAETRLKQLADAVVYTGDPEINGQKSLLVKRFERDIFDGVKLASQQRINAFIEAHAVAIDNVPALYADSAFQPVYVLTYSSTGPADLAQKRKQIDSYLENIKYNQFPESSIKAIYAEFTRNPRERGVEKARAIVEHGKFYRGQDQKVKGLITECDVDAAKWVVRPAEYRKLFALPITSNKSGTNEYMFRIRLQIPSEAQFPVFDINLKLPQEVAEKSNQTQWYESITIDKKPLKNEGRFRITAPTAVNNYEVLITPVQMDKEGRNILEVRFKYPGFRVFEVSAMAQVPIIRKN